MSNADEMRGLYEKYLGGECVNVFFPLPDDQEDGYTRRFQPPVRLLLLGGGYVAQALCRLASLLGFVVSAADDRPAFANRANFPTAAEVICDAFPAAVEKMEITDRDYAAVLTRGHKHDSDCLRAILRGRVPDYLGLIGSRRRVRELFKVLASEGCDPLRLEKIHAPIGLEIGAVTPDEIALSILSEMVQHRGETSGKAYGVLEQTNADPVLLKFMALDREEKIVAVVVERLGSTPVKTGAVMAIDRAGHTYGTVGGGCGEHEVVMAALRAFDAKKDSRTTVDMTNETAADEGMACGGKMTLLLRYIEAEEQ